MGEALFYLFVFIVGVVFFFVQRSRSRENTNKAIEEVKKVIDQLPQDQPTHVTNNIQQHFHINQEDFIPPNQ